MKENGFIIILKGAVVGATNVVAGISGGTIAYILGIFDKVIFSLANITKKGKFLENFLYLLKFGIGAVFGVLVFSKLLDKLFGIIMLELVTFFAGVLIGGVFNDIPSLKLTAEEKPKSWKNWLGFSISFIVVIVLSFVNLKVSAGEANYDELWVDISFSQMLLLFFSIIIGAIAMIFPGISGSMVFMIFGIYYPVVNGISNLTDFSKYGDLGFWLDNVKLLLPLLIGGALSLLLVAKPLKMLLEKYHKLCLYIIMGFVVSSVFAIYILNANNIISQFKWWHLVIALFGALPLGLFTSVGLQKWGDKIKHKKEEKEDTSLSS